MQIIYALAKLAAAESESDDDEDMSGEDESEGSDDGMIDREAVEADSDVCSFSISSCVNYNFSLFAGG